MTQTNELFIRFKDRLESVGGEAHSVENLEQATEIIVAHPELVQKEIVVAPNFATFQFWAAILPLLRDKGIDVREAENPASVADAPAGLSIAELAIAETGSVLLAENALEARVVRHADPDPFCACAQRDVVSHARRCWKTVSRVNEVWI